MNKDNVKLGLRIKAAREKASMNQAEFAEKLGIFPTHLNRWEKGKVAPGWTALVEIAMICNVTLDWLLTGNDVSDKLTAATSKNLNKDLEKILYWLQNNPLDVPLFLKLIKGKKEIKSALEALRLLGLSSSLAERP